MKEEIFTMYTAKQELAKERGARVKLARQLANLTRRQMSEKHNINIHTIHGWEKGANCISKEKADMLEIAFKNEGLNVTAHWLLYGADSHSFSQADNSSFKDALNLQGDLQILSEIEFFRQNALDAIVTLVTDNALYPLFAKGDYVGGIQEIEDYSQNLVGKFCIVTLQDNVSIARKIFSIKENGKMMVGAINPFVNLGAPDVCEVDVRQIAIITRHWIIGERLSN